MLLCCFLSVYSAAVAVLQPPRQGTPERQRIQGGVTILHESPNTVWQKKEAARARYANISPLGPLRYHDKKFSVYAALHGNTDSHMTICRTIVSESQYQELCFNLCQISGATFEEQESTSVFSIPCTVGIVQRRDATTGIVSPSRKIETAFSNSTATILEWIKSAEELNGTTTISDLLKNLANNIQLGYYPFGHTQQKAFSGQSSEFLYKFCQIEIQELPQWKIQHIKKKRSKTIEKLTKWVDKAEIYSQSNLNITSEQLRKIDEMLETMGSNAIFNAPPALLQKALEVFKDTNIDELIITAQAELLKDPKNLITKGKIINILQSIKFIGAYDQLLYQELMSEDLLKGAFISINSTKFCYRVAKLWLEALGREIRRGF